MQPEPLISIIVPYYKLADYITQTINCILEQSYSYWECIIINDGSPDKSEAICKRETEKDSRIYYYLKENGGSASARKLGYEKAKGKYIVFLDGDDLIGSDYLEKMVKCFELDNNLDIAICNYRVLDDRFNSYKANGMEMRIENFSYKNILLNWDKTFAFPTHCCLYKKTLFSGYSFNLMLKSKEDWVMALQLFKKAKKITFINEDLAVYRFRLNSKMKSKNYLKNLFGTFNYLMEEEVEESLKLDFFKKVNEFWIEQVDEKDRYINTLLKSTKFRIGNIISLPFYKLYLFLTK